MRLVSAATLLWAMGLFALALVRVLPVVLAALVLAGVGWTLVLSNLQVSAQIAAPDWVMARALSVYQLVFMGGTAAGSALWGAVADRFGPPVALGAAGLGLLLGISAALHYKLPRGEELKLSPALRWPEPVVVGDVDPEKGPVLITVEYHIKPDQAPEFLAVLRRLGVARRREGAMRWGIFRDSTDPGRYIEAFTVESWADHLRQHEHYSDAAWKLEEEASALVTGGEPSVSHLVAPSAEAIGE